MVERSIGLVTALNPVIGYETATKLATEALETGRGIVEIVRERGILSEEEIEEILDPAKMTGEVQTTDRRGSTREILTSPTPEAETGHGQSP